MQNYIRKSALMMKLPSKMLKSSKENSWKSRQQKKIEQTNIQGNKKQSTGYKVYGIKRNITSCIQTYEIAYVCIKGNGSNAITITIKRI